ncbi:MAG: BspA family leucine-rich repeat surface protein, partial [Bacteroidetes bacterium]|nr:BspA family leucine-rich repeat surface protein [Bacteroidota bacterium]
MRMSWLPIIDILRWENVVENGLRIFDPLKTGIFGLVSVNGPVLHGTFIQSFWDNFTDSPTIAIGDIDVSQYKGAVGTFWGVDENWITFLSMTDQNPDANPDLFTFNEDVSGWDVSNFRVLNSVFSGQGNFSQNLGSWDTSNVEDMYACFRNNRRLVSG